MRVLPVVMLISGTVLIWCGITSRNPIDVIKNVMTGKDVPEEGSLGKIGRMKMDSTGTEAPNEEGNSIAT